MRTNEVIPDLKDPRGWTVENNPNPAPYYMRLYHVRRDDTHWSDYMEFDKYGHVTTCHSCIRRAKLGSGNCQDGGEYFICLPKEVREGKLSIKKPVKTEQSKLM